MNSKSLHIAMRETIEQFGFDVLTENRLVNILLDLGAYSDVPASKTIIQAIVSGGYSQKILNLGQNNRSFISSILDSGDTTGKPEGEEWRNKLKSYSAIISKKNGFQQSLVDYVVECMVYGLDWIDYIPETPKSQKASQTQARPFGPQPKQVNSATTSGTNANKTNSVTYQNISNTQFLVMGVRPANAEVFVDGKQQFVSNGVMAVELPVGMHSYEVKANSYKTKSGNVDITSDSKVERMVILQLEQKTVKLTIEAADSDTEIYINNVCYGKGKWEGLVDEGTYDIEGRKHRYYTNKQVVTLQGTNKEKILIPSLIALCGNLKVNVQPYGSTIIINGQDVGATPLLVQNVVIGERNLTIKTNEGTEYTTTVEVRENQVTDVNHIIPSLFLYDYSELKIGDYFYEDGSFSHRIAKGKKMVGVVFNLNPSEEEKKNGWTHGQILAMESIKNYSGLNVHLTSWGVATQELLQYAVFLPQVNNIDNGYQITHLDSVLNNPEFKPFIEAAQYNAKLPLNTSGWYLPCIAQWKLIHECFFNTERWKTLKLTGHGSYGSFATSSLCDRNNAWKYELDYLKSYSLKANVKASIAKYDAYNVRAVASF